MPITKKIFRWSLVAILIFLGFCLISWLCSCFDRPLTRNFFLNLLPVEASFLAIFVTFFAVGKKVSQAPQLIKSFFTYRPVAIVAIIMAITLVMAVASKDAPAGAGGNDPADSDDSQTVTYNGSAKEPAVPDSPVPDQNISTTAPESAAPPEPYLSLAEWESDPFLLRLDTYCNYHVEEENVEDMVCSLLSKCWKEIPVRGRYDTDLLNGKDSEYAEHTAYANELRQGYTLLTDAQILRDKQLEFLNDEIRSRIDADGLYQVSENERIIGNIFLKLGDVCIQNRDISGAHENYTHAFSWFQTTFRTAVAEGADQAELEAIYGSIVNAKDKLLNLEGIDSHEKNMAPKIVYAFEQLLAAQ